MASSHGYGQASMAAVASLRPKLPRIQEAPIAASDRESAVELAAAVAVPPVQVPPIVRDDEEWFTTTRATLIHLRAGALHWYATCSFRQRSRKPIAPASVSEVGSYASAATQGRHFCSDCLKEAGRL